MEELNGKIIEEHYAETADITFIVEDTYKDGEIISTEVKGFYYGEPDEENTKEFYGKLKVVY